MKKLPPPKTSKPKTAKPTDLAAVQGGLVEISGITGDSKTIVGG